MIKKYNRNQRRYKKRYPKKTNNGSTLGNVASIAKTAFKTAKWVAALVNAEYKYQEASVSLQVPTWNGTLYTLAVPAQSTGATGRTGDSIKLKALTLRGLIDYNTLGIAEMVRVIIFVDKQNVVTTGAQLLQYTGVYMATNSPKNEGNKFDTKILYDKAFPVSVYRPQAKFNVVLKLGFHVHFAAGTTTVENNALKMCFISQNPANSPKFSYISRVTFVDN